MSSNSLRILAGAAVALALSGTAIANTNLDGTSTGDIFLNIVDTTNQNSYVFDTGISQASFTGTGSISAIDLTTITNGNYSSFIAGTAGHTLNYSVVSGTFDGGTAAKVLYTSNLSQNSVVGSQLLQSWASLNNFTPVANGISTTSTQDAILPAGAPPWGDPGVEGIFASNLTANANGDNAAIGTPLAFYSQANADITSDTLQSTLAHFAGTWDLTAAGLLSYTVAGAVPLPAPLLLLLSGLGLTGLLGRRKSLTVESGAVAI